jgi:hypothetical protein
MESDFRYMGLDSDLCGSYCESVDLASTRRDAAVFMDNILAADFALERPRWFSRWTRIGESYYLTADHSLKRAAFDRALEAWLCALTAFAVAKCLVDPNGRASAETAKKIQTCVHKFALYCEPRGERIRIPCYDHLEIEASFLPAAGCETRAPSIICVSDEDESADALLGKILPAAIGRGMSLLIVEGSDISNRLVARTDILLGCCLEYLAARPDVDESRIAVYGEKLAATSVASFAASDRRLAAAVCDGGLWNAARMRASIGWLSGPGEVDEEKASMCRSRLARRIKCPVLVIASEHSAVYASEAIALQADCKAAGIDIDVAIPRTIQTPLGTIENFVTIDEFSFGWFEQKLAARRAQLTLKYL